jgi:hypothetical protein
MKTKKELIKQLIEYILCNLDAFNLVQWIPTGVINQVKKNLVKLDNSTLSLLVVLTGMLKIGIEDEFELNIVSEEPSQKQITRAVKTLKNAVYHAEDSLLEQYPEETKPMPDKMLDRVETRQVKAKNNLAQVSCYLEVQA